MKWYIPSWNGDLRLTPDETDKNKTCLSIVKPTDDEKRILEMLGKKLLELGLVDAWDPVLSSGSGKGLKRLFHGKHEVLIHAPLEKIGPLVARIAKPGPAVLTAITFKDGTCTTCSGGLMELVAIAEEAAARPPEKAPEAAATVKRPTPSCPQCVPGSIEPASEVLLAFLNEEEHASWAKDRALVVEGGLSGHRYLIAHRHSPRAERQGRICYDLDSDCIVHFHDWTVPPEEEVLAAKLILEHREPWLRNEATMLGVGGRTMVFKNPFGDVMDGVEDAIFTQQIGDIARPMLEGLAALLGGH